MTIGIQQLIRAMEQVTDRFHAAVYSDHDVEAALAVTDSDCVLVNTPMGTGSRRVDGLRAHLTEEVLPHLPADLTFRRVSRTVDQRRAVEELTVGFTYDREMPWLLPDAQPTHRHAEVLAISVVTFRHTSRLGVTESRISAHRTLWDHSGLLAQLRLDRSAPVPLS